VGVQTLRVRPDALPVYVRLALVEAAGEVRHTHAYLGKPLRVPYLGKVREVVTLPKDLAASQANARPPLVHFLVSSSTWIPSLGRNVIEASGVTL
jgi:hypothetical protein